MGADAGIDAGALRNETRSMMQIRQQDAPVVDRLIGGIQHHFVSRAPEWVLASVLILEGWLLLLPGDTLSSTSAYRPLQQLASEDQWGTAAVCIGTLWLFALVLNGSFAGFRRVSPWARAICCLATASYMSLFASGMRVGNPSGDGYLMHGGWAVMALVYCAIIAREVRHVDREAVRWRALRSRQRQANGIR